MTDKQRLDWLEAQEGCALVSDEAGSLIEKQDWQSSIRKAIDYAIKQAE